ncbi:hypothetical protein [Allosalinactinospora lopnorensis]|uniref:hypothetical protein n=1 Tax=Allosalinactinospora lopnorensis TaxID=1352348 RepID=UPI0012E276F0|nr:hypothetical protein [Allosalinactinospora lopnorensis]
MHDVSKHGQSIANNIKSGASQAGHNDDETGSEYSDAGSNLARDINSGLPPQVR